MAKYLPKDLVDKHTGQAAIYVSDIYPTTNDSFEKG